MSFLNKGITHLRPWWLVLFGLVLTVLGTPWGGTSLAAGLEVRRVGLSRVGENTMLTVVLDREAEPRISTRMEEGRPQLVVDFPQAQAGYLPTRLEGDDQLVEQVITETSAARPGVRIILQLFPGQPYTYWRLVRPGAAKQKLFILGLKPDLKAAAPDRTRIPEPPERTYTPEPPSRTYTPEPSVPPPVAQERQPEPLPPGSEDYTPRPERGTVGGGSFADLRRLIPKADPLFQQLEKDGWTVGEAHTYDRPGQRFSRDFILRNGRHPELSIKIANLPANTPNTPSINFITLTTDNVGGETAAKYKEMRRWSFSHIKRKFEDIGDFFDDALKPLRVKLREQTKALALSRAAVFQGFLQRACPQNPQVAEKAMNHIREKVSPRFEGVQYTLSENPLVILNMVDFLYVRVYFLESAG